MADIARTIAKASTMTPEVHLIETSPRLVDIQQEKLKAHWHLDMSTVPAGPFILVANEFLDALPIRQFEMTKDGWAEAFIEATDDGTLKRGLKPTAAPVLTAAPANFGDARPGDIVETCPAAEAFVSDIATRLNRDGGVALFLDYGYGTAAFGDSLQALFKGNYADPLDHPGEADITAHVNFKALLNIAKNHNAHGFGPIEQGKFLEQLGLFVRADALKQQASVSQRSLIDLAVHRLTSLDQMGSLFRVAAIASDADLQPAGFAP